MVYITFMRIGMFLVLLITNWRLANLKNYRLYYPTIAFIMVINLVASYLTYDHPLWYFQKSKLFPNDAMVDLWLTFVTFPLIVILYLSRYPYQSQWKRQFAYIAQWGFLFSLIEGIFIITKGLTYQNGWNFWWSVVVWLVMFPVFTLHHRKRYLWAWFICIGFLLFIIYYFDIPITEMK
ncbi:MAG TPA: CBO0543 family protein [Bacillota bacterium]|nr:CBO0543 family protein [Bacillota bacterium]